MSALWGAIWIGGGWLSALTGCTTVHGVKPVGDGNVALEGSFGGPITEIYGLPIPLPFSSIGVDYGLDDRTDLHGAFHPTALLAVGVVQLEVGASRALLDQAGGRPRLMADLTLIGAGGPVVEREPEGGFALYMQPTLNAAWDWGRRGRQTAYTGVTVFTQVAPTLQALGAWQVGQRWGIGPRLHLDTELKWIAPYADSAMLVTNYYAPWQQGAISFQLGFGYTFGKGGQGAKEGA